MRPVNEIIVHCTATPEGRTVAVAEIDAWHRARGWSGCGYHRIIGLLGERWQGRALDKIGAHCEGHNSATIGIVYVGGLTRDGRDAKDTRTTAQRIALHEELIDLRDRFNIQKVSGHNEYANKACPCFDASAEYDHLFEGRSKGFTPVLDRVLRRGHVGNDVAVWIDRLMDWRKVTGSTVILRAGSVFDQAVEMETLAFQRARGIVIDGKAGPQTYSEMERALLGQKPFQAMEAA
ncbi:peptidoglycan recognition protein family protein [Rhizobium sp. SL86]|uniref:peptidoglycan recognition protein family protein n=1 Tax=Rhizobium sp. SL86 TaxID=2995148 RepID=UPI0022726239|nr:N-acetylmuramoyl-L-alanine amidase [Rhizobium sp. SL86]MCY1667872.1 N-acetylmuramoyl-L-alanine amidase [Rhizobium sp. SL86]